MAKYALWYFKPQWGNYETFDTNMPTSRLSDLGFDYLIILDTVGEGGKYGQMPMSGYTYEAGYNDGKKLAQWIEREVGPELPYLVEIPVLVRENDEQWKLFENSNYTIPPDVRNLDYLRGWVDGVYTNTGGFEKGFYWNLEFSWQVVKGVVSESVIRELSEKILGWGQEFIWIPYGHGDVNWENTDIKTLDRYFTYIFAQPNYYQGKTSDLGTWFTNFKEFRDGNNLSNLYMEMECDGKVNPANPSVTQETAEKHKSLACDYVQYAKNFPHRAYYFDTDVENLRIMEDYCRSHGKKYIF